MTEDYRTEARSARAEARETLRALRAARRARARGQAAAAAPRKPAEPPAERAIAPAPDIAPPLAGRPPPGLMVSAAAQDLSRAAQTAEAWPRPTTAESGAEEKAPDAGATAHFGSNPTGASAPSPGSSSRDAPTAAPAPPEEESELMVLPGVGPGLVHLFNQAGVTSLADLAKADAARLATDLGLVGQLLDLPAWIALAARADPVAPARDIP